MHFCIGVFGCNSLVNNFFTCLNGVYLHQQLKWNMARQSITLANQNDEWLKKQVANEEFTSKSEAVNFLIKQAREHDAYVDFVRKKIESAEKSGFSTKTKEELLANIKKKLNV
jgi:antitoxin ParD1/3/4